MLNMDNLNRIDKIGRENVVMWSVEDIVSTVAYVAYEQFLGEYPRNLEEVTEQLKVKLRKKAKQCMTVYLIESTLNNITRLTYDTLMTIEEFVDWNERVNNYFVDLNAFGQSVYCQLRSKLIEDIFFEEEYLKPEQFAQKMRMIVDEYSDDPEFRHQEMDNLMCIVLDRLGYSEGVFVFRKSERYYS